MANHVHFAVAFHQINDEARIKLKSMFERVREDSPHDWFSDIFVEGDLTYEETEKYEWTTANIGPKWCYFEDYSAEKGDVYFTGESAWSAPTEGLQKLLGILVEYDPKIITSICYEDEGPNFFGVEIYDGEEMYDGSEYSYEETIDLVIKDSERLTEDSYNTETEEWIDEEAEDVFHEEMWETISNVQYSLIGECEELIKGNQEEEILQDE